MQSICEEAALSKNIFGVTPPTLLGAIAYMQI